MPIKAIRMYQSEDGKVHSTMPEATKYNAQQKALSGVKAALAAATPSLRGDLLPIDLLNNPKAAAELRDQLNKVLEYHRNYGKLKKVATP